MGALLALDATLARWINGLAGVPALDWLMVALTLSGAHAAIWLALGVVAAWRSGAAARGVVRMAWGLALAALLVNGVLKPLVDRQRPFVRDPAVHLVGPAPSGASFPSGHAASAVAGAYGLAFVWPRRRALLWTLGAAIALSRIYLGVHYPTDVAAGALVGWGVARLATGRAPCYSSASANVPR
jgi:membrane-associated phospholipid phosphatase